MRIFPSESCASLLITFVRRRCDASEKPEMRTFQMLDCSEVPKWRVGMRDFPLESGASLSMKNLKKDVRFSVGAKIFTSFCAFSVDRG